MSLRFIKIESVIETEDRVVDTNTGHTYVVRDPFTFDRPYDAVAVYSQHRIYRVRARAVWGNPEPFEYVAWSPQLRRWVTEENFTDLMQAIDDAEPRTPPRVPRAPRAPRAPRVATRRRLRVVFLNPPDLSDLPEAPLPPREPREPREQEEPPIIRRLSLSDVEEDVAVAASNDVPGPIVRWQDYFEDEDAAEAAGYVVPPGAAPRQRPEDRCPVCLESFRDRMRDNIGVVRLPCGHMICRVCFVGQTREDHSITHGFGQNVHRMRRFVCPLCRGPFDPLNCRDAEYAGDGKYSLQTLHF